MTDKKTPSSPLSPSPQTPPETGVGRPQIPEYLPPETLDPELYRELVAVRKMFAKAEGFPTGWCEATSLALKDLGLPSTGGHYHSPQSGLTYPHHWNVTPDGKHAIDLTHDQFDPNAPGVAILPANTPVLHAVAHMVKYHQKRPADEG